MHRVRKATKEDEEPPHQEHRGDEHHMFRASEACGRCRKVNGGKAAALASPYWKDLLTAPTGFI